MVKLDGDFTEFTEGDGEQTFVANLAEGLSISPDNIEITSITEGSIVVEYNIILDDLVEMNAEELITL